MSKPFQLSIIEINIRVDISKCYKYMHMNFTLDSVHLLMISCTYKIYAYFYKIQTSSWNVFSLLYGAGQYYGWDGGFGESGGGGV